MCNWPFQNEKEAQTYPLKNSAPHSYFHEKICLLSSVSRGLESRSFLRLKKPLLS